MFASGRGNGWHTMTEMSRRKYVTGGHDDIGVM